jgi:hypothetical protein
MPPAADGDEAAEQGSATDESDGTANFRQVSTGGQARVAWIGGLWLDRLSGGRFDRLGGRRLYGFGGGRFNRLCGRRLNRFGGRRRDRLGGSRLRGAAGYIITDYWTTNEHRTKAKYSQ